MSFSASLPNGTRSEVGEEMDVEFDPVLDVFPLVFAFLIALTNGFIVWLIASKKNLHSITNKWLASLACCDFFMGFVCVPLYVSCNSTWNTPVCFTTVTVIKLISIATLLHILAITFDRYIFILHPLRYTLLITHCRTYVAMIVLWLVSSGVAVTQLTWISVDIDVSEDTREQEEINNRIYDTSCTVIFFIVPLGFMVYAYARIFWEVRKQCIKIKRDNTLRKASTSLEKARERRSIVMYVMILLLYVVGWMPYFLVILQHSLGMKLTFEMTHEMEYFFNILRILSSFVRPALYTVGKHDLRKAATSKIKEFPKHFRKTKR